MKKKNVQFSVFSNKNNIQLKLSIGSSLLAKQMDTKFLGVYLSTNLSWNKHIDMVVNEISMNVGIIAKVRHLLLVSHTCTLYKTLVEPYLSYCNLIWALHDSSTVRPEFIVATFAKEEFFLCKGTISSLAKEYLEIGNFKRFARFPLQRYP